MDPGGLADQEPFTAWLRRGVGRDRIFAEPKLYEPLGTAALIREPSRQRFARSRAIIRASASNYILKQYCPVNLRGLGEKANSGGAFQVTRGVSDLNRKWSFALASRVFARRIQVANA
jgi:hypothetical protein